MSMQEHLDKNDVVNSIRLQLRHPSGVDKIWIIVEGESDQKLYSKLIISKNVEIEISYGGLTSLLASVSELLLETDRILGIRDADFLNLEGKKETVENIFQTDFHDVEMMIISCDNAFRGVVAEYLSKEKDPTILREKLLKSVPFLGGLRWINDSDSLELNFKNIGLGNFFNGNTFSLDKNQCLEDVLKRSPNKRKEISIEDVTSKIQGVSDFFNLCNGHDFQKGFALRIKAASNKGVKEETIGQAFHIAYRFEDFEKTKLYKSLKSWATRKKYKLFNNE